MKKNIIASVAGRKNSHNSTVQIHDGIARRRELVGYINHLLAEVEVDTQKEPRFIFGMGDEVTTVTYDTMISGILGKQECREVNLVDCSVFDLEELLRAISGAYWSLGAGHVMNINKARCNSHTKVLLKSIEDVLSVSLQDTKYYLNENKEVYFQTSKDGSRCYPEKTDSDYFHVVTSADLANIND